MVICTDCGGNRGFCDCIPHCPVCKAVLLTKWPIGRLTPIEGLPEDVEKNEKTIYYTCKREHAEEHKGNHFVFHKKGLYVYNGRFNNWRKFK